MAVLLAAVAAAARTAGPTPTAHGVLVTVGGQELELAVAGPSAFRATAGANGTVPASPMLAPSPAYAAFSVVSDGAVQGVKTAFGELVADTGTGQLLLKDAKGATIAQTAAHAGLSAPRKDTCTNPVAGVDWNGASRASGGALNVSSQAACCDACNKNAGCAVWEFATGNPGDGGAHNCWLLSHVSGQKQAADRVTGGSVPPAPPAQFAPAFQLAAGARLYGSGAGGGSAETLLRTNGHAKVGNTESDTAYYWSSEGYAALGVGGGTEGSTKWASANGAAAWSGVHDLYLMPAASVDAGTKAFFDLTGAPPVPPRYALGFLACRWGWVDRDYIHEMLTNFRDGSFPLDAWISDFEWFTKTPDYSLPSSGSADYHDFGYNNITFPEPQAQLKQYKEELHLRFGGIRKPRFGNSDLLVMARQKGWTIGSGRNLDYSIPEVREYYQQQQLHYHKDGVAFWWNDEGETEYFTFYWWNAAEVETLKQYDPKARFFSINRAYSPGMSRLGATLWTGDIHAAWEDLKRTPGYMLNWGLMGAPYVTCDIGGFSGQTNPLLLTRWYQAGVFLPVMRVHSTRNAQPHFPFLWGDAAAGAMRKALGLRYQMIPLLYSLAHAATSEGRLLMRPLMADFAADAATHDLTSQWMVGDSVMVAPVLSEDNSTTVHFPAGSGTWYELNSTRTQQGGKDVKIAAAALDLLPVYARAGAVLPLAPPGLQWSDQLPGGALEVQVYGGSDGSFALVEDDGETTGYEGGAKRTTTFSWDDAKGTLSWEVSGSFSDAHTFTQLRAVKFSGGARSESAVVAIGKSGSVKP